MQKYHYATKEVSKKKVDRYHMRFSSGWAIFVVDEDTGSLLVESDWGNWCYRWGSPGESLKEFLVGCNWQYVADKFSYGAKDHFYSEDTVRQMRKQILQARKSGELTKQNARGFLNWINKNKSSLEDSETAREFEESFAQASEQPGLREFFNAPWEVPYVSGRHPRLNHFMEWVWPKFIDVLRAETKKPKWYQTFARMMKFA